MKKFFSFPFTFTCMGVVALLLAMAWLSASFFNMNPLHAQSGQKYATGETFSHPTMYWEASIMLP
jgi:hypothetical protein